METLDYVFLIKIKNIWIIYILYLKRILEHHLKKFKEKKKIKKLKGLLQTDIWCSTLRFVLFN